MSDLEPVGSKEITNAGVRGVGSTIGGVALLLLRGVSGFLGGIGGLVIGAISMIVGASSLKSQSKTDRRGGTIALVAGAVVALPGIARILGKVPIIGGLVNAVSGISWGIIALGAFGLIGYGVYNIVKFVKGIKSRR